MSKELLSGLEGRYRIGAVAKMTGLSVATLRVWQTRHRVVQPSMSEGGQRLYSEQEVKKLALIKGLTLVGQPLGLIAGMDVAQLQELAHKQQLLTASPKPQAHESLKMLQPSSQKAWTGAQDKSLCLVGSGLYLRLNALRFSFALAQVNLQLHQESDLPPLLKKLEGRPSNATHEASCYLIKLNSTNAESLKDLKALRELLPGARIAVLYHYALAHELQGMRSLGLEVKRDTLLGQEMLDWVMSLLLTDTQAELQEGSQVEKIGSPNQRLFSNEALAHFAQIDKSLLCECPKHLAQIIEQLASFELYSLHCLSTSPQDEALHASLHQVSSNCRALLEKSLLQVVQYEGLELPDFREVQAQGSLGLAS